MRLPNHACLLAAGCLALGTGGGAGFAEPVGNGNELALAYASATNAAGRQLIQQTATGALQTFRYLKITAIASNAPVPGAMTLTTVEPSSDLQVVLVVTKKLSLELARTLTTNDCVAANGRVKSIGEESAKLLILDPVVLKYKDRAGPKMSKELLHEVDPTAH